LCDTNFDLHQPLDDTGGPNSEAAIAVCHRLRRLDWRRRLPGWLDCRKHGWAMQVHRPDQGRSQRIFAVFVLLVGLSTPASATGLISIRIK
jgi:hypothetical protein